MGPNLLMTTFWKNYGAKKEAHAEGEEIFSKNVLHHYINGNANILSEDWKYKNWALAKMQLKIWANQN